MFFILEKMITIQFAYIRTVKNKQKNPRMWPANFAELEIGKRPAYLPDFRDFSKNDNTEETNQCVEDTVKEEEEKTWYERSCEARENRSLDTEIGDSEVLGTGIQLSQRCRKNYSSTFNKHRPFRYEQQLERNELLELRKRQPDKFKKCRLQTEASNLTVAFNTDPGDSIKQIIIDGRSRCGKSFNDDEVLVEVEESRVKACQSGTGKLVAYGKVKGVLDRKRYKRRSTSSFRLRNG